MKHKLVAGVTLLAILACLSWAFSGASWLEENSKSKSTAFPDQQSKADSSCDSLSWVRR